MVEGLVAAVAALPASSVLVYLSMPGEIPAERVVEPLLGLHRFFTTRTPETGWLSIHPIDAPRETHRLGYPQPASGSRAVDPADVGVALVPGLCFDRFGGRIGWGKGYYDELLSRMPRSMRIGVTLERRIVESIPLEPHDVRMTHLATERGVRSVSP